MGDQEKVSIGEHLFQTLAGIGTLILLGSMLGWYVAWSGEAHMWVLGATLVGALLLGIGIAGSKQLKRNFGPRFPPSGGDNAN